MDEKNKMKLVNCLSLKTGTKVRIRKWEDLKKEHIYCGFNDEMAKCCGKIVTVKSFTKATFQDVYGLVKVFFFEGTEKEDYYINPLFKWTWTNQMIELFDQKSKDCLNKI